MRRNRLAMVCMVLSLSVAGQSHAGYGLNAPAQGAQSAGYANAVLAVTDDTDALNVNPAGLSRIESSRLDLMVEPFLWLSSHRDGIGGTSRPSTPGSAIASGGFATRLNPKWVVGVAMGVQGGVGFAYNDLPNAFGPPDDVSALFGSFKIAPGTSWQVSDHVSLGLSVGLVYSTARQKLLPKTSTAGFNGFRLDSLSGFSSNARAGLLWDINPQWTLAAVYATKTPVKLDGGRMTLNRSATSEPSLIYDDVSLKGLNFAQEASLGFAYRPSERWLLSANLSWLDWSSALKSSRLHASDPNDASAPDLNLAAPLNFRDQVVICVGGSYQWTSKTALRAGAGYGRNPQGEEGLSPAINLVSDRTLSLGVRHRFDETWQFDGAVLYQPAVGMDYSNPIYGGPAEEKFGALAFYLGVSRRW